MNLLSCVANIFFSFRERTTIMRNTSCPPGGLWATDGRTEWKEGGERVRKRVEEVILCCGCNLSHQTVRPIITPSILNHPPFYYLFLRRPPKVALLLLLLLFSLWKATQRLVFIGKVNMPAAKEPRLDDSLSLRLYNFETVVLF